MAVNQSRLDEYNRLYQAANKEAASEHYEEAESLFNQAIEINPQPLDPYMVRCKVFDKVGKIHAGKEGRRTGYSSIETQRR